MGTKRFEERIEAPFAGGVTVDRAKGTIGGVLVCGFQSENGREYPAEVLREAANRYEGRVVNCDHGKEATVDRRLGWLTDVQAGPDGRPRAVLNVLKSHPMADRVFEAAERNPSLYGMSHVAVCRSKLNSRGIEVIESIVSVESVDLVAAPATTKGLHESIKGKTSMITIKKLLEKIAAKSNVDQIMKLKRLTEDYGDTPMDMDPAEDMSADDGITAAFEAAIMSVVKDALKNGADKKEVLTKIKKLLGAHGDVQGDGGDDSDDGAGAGAGDDSDKVESKQGKSILAALTICEEIGFRADRTDLEVIAATVPDRRKVVAKRLMEAVTKSATPGPKSSPRGAGGTDTTGLGSKTEIKAEGVIATKKLDDDTTWLD